MRLMERLTKLETTRRGWGLSSMSDDELEAAILDVSRRVLRNPEHDEVTVHLAQQEVDRAAGSGLSWIDPTSPEFAS